MKKTKYIYSILIILALFITLFYKIIFQEWNPLPMLKGIVKLEVLNSNYVKIWDNKYIAQNNTMDRFIEEKWYTLKDQMWGGYFLENEDLDNIILTKRMFTKKYNIYELNCIKTNLTKCSNFN